MCVCAVTLFMFNYISNFSAIHSFCLHVPFQFTHDHKLFVAFVFQVTISYLLKGVQVYIYDITSLTIQVLHLL